MVCVEILAKRSLGHLLLLDTRISVQDVTIARPYLELQSSCVCMFERSSVQDSSIFCVVPRIGLHSQLCVHVRIRLSSDSPSGDAGSSEELSFVFDLVIAVSHLEQ